MGAGAAALLVAACADIFGIHSAEVGDGSVVDGSADAPNDVPYDYVVHDALDIDVNSATCDGGIPLVDTDAAVWVSVALGSDGPTCGAQGTPCKSIATALQNRGSRSVVYLDNAVFTELVKLGASASNVTLQGGWTTDGGWVAVCDSSKTTIQAPDDASAAVEISSTNAVTLRLLTIKSKVQGVNGAGESVYAVRVIDAPDVAIDNCTLVAQNAGGGTPGSTPLNPGSCTGNSGTGQTGVGGSPGGPGSFVGNGFQPVTGGGGGPGTNGFLKPPGAGQCGMCNQGCP